LPDAGEHHADGFLGRWRRLPKLSSSIDVVARIPSRLLIAIRAVFKQATDRIFGYDVFLSYSWRDGLQYTRDLAEELTRLRFSVFIDTKEYVAGTDLVPSTQRRVRMSRHFVLVLRPNASLSEWVRKEVMAFLPTGRPLIAIDVNRTWLGLPPDSYLREVLEHRLRISETLPTSDAPPAAATVGELVRSFTGTRRETTRLRLVTAVAMALLVLGVVSFWQWQAAIARLRESQILTMRLLSGIPEFDKAADLAAAAAGTDERRSRPAPVVPRADGSRRGRRRHRIARIPASIGLAGRLW
jgi:hypothetical protein